MNDTMKGGRAFEPGPDDIEQWLPIDGWPGYTVSDWGRVRTYWGPGGATQGHRAIGARFKYLAGTIKKGGHRLVELYRDGSREVRRVYVHVLVLEAFKGPCPEGQECCHWDGNPLNNRVDNLRWDTHLANMQDNFHHGKRGYAKLAPDDIPAIWTRLVTGQESDSTIARDYGISAAAIKDIRNGRNWSHLTRSLSGVPIAFRSALLTESEVVEIRKINPMGRQVKQVAAIYGVDSETIRLILNRQTWKHVIDDPPFRLEHRP